MLAQTDSANTAHWVDSLRRFGGAEVRVWSMPVHPSWRRLLAIPWYVRSVRKQIDQFKPDVLIGYRSTSYGFIAALTGYRPVVVAAQGESDVWPAGHWSNAITSRMARYSLRRADLIHAWGPTMVPSLLELGSATEKVMILPRGIDLDQFPFHEPFENDRSFSCVVSRSLFPEYHHDVLIEAFSAAVHSLPGVSCHLVIAGDGPLRGPLEQQCAALGISGNVEFCGKLAPDHLAQVLHKADAYLSLPETEGVSASLLEAMAAGCIPVVTDLPANRDWVEHGVNGFLVQGVASAVREALIQLWADRQRYRRIAMENRNVVARRADARKNAVTFVNCYKTLASEK
jgi:glycosyltransferase involved in cell wall biosynthesis